MQNVLSLVLFGLFFYFMMRFGCGSHAVHGHHHHETASGSVTRGMKDPVCGMNVAAGQGYKEAYKGIEYNFCSRKCLDKFDANPAQYVPTT